jgi:two-component system, chemotaxis family, sensor kinase CheA
MALLGLRSPITTAGSQQISGVASNDPAVLRDAIQRLAKDMGRSVNRLSLLSEALQSQARTMRLVPMSTLLQPMARSVRDIARELGKNVNYQVTGGDVEMDRPVLEGIKDPLMHLLRNAIDHGIETPDERRAKGKAETGTLSISVDTRGNQISVIVRDDGAGINVDSIVRKAVSKKLITTAEVQTMSRAEKLDVVFRPGFSSKEIITDISGRGVGLDVVLSSMRSLKGRVQLDSVEGEGSTFTLTVPLTLSTEHGLLVRAGKAVFALPITSVERVMDVDPSELTEVEASQALVIGGTAVPVRELAAVLDLETNSGMARERLVVVVVAKGWQRIALLVDEIVGEREIVVKRFRPPLISVQNVIGGALTGSGEVIVVLNSADVVTSGLRQSTGRLAQRTASGDTDVAPAHILVADDSITARTLETSILETRGYQVTATADGEQAWEALQKDTFDLVLSDVEMPLLNGFELTQRIKANETYRHLPVVIVTSLANDADRRRGVEVGADAYIVKRQFETQALLEIIEQLI